MLILQTNTQFTDHYVDVNGYKTRYWDIGFSDSIVILIHGFALSCDVWQQNIQELAKKHRVIALDYWGCGQTQAPSTPSGIYEYPQFLIWFMDVLKIKKAKLVGHSLGGVCVLKLAYDYPEYIEKIMLLSPAGFKTGIIWHFRFFTIPVIGQFFGEFTRPKLRYIFLQNLYDKNQNFESYIDLLVKYSKKSYAAKYLVNLLKSGTTPFGIRRGLIHTLKKGAKNIKCPVLILWGKNDRILSCNGALYAKKLIPHARLEFLDKCGHIPQLEHPTKFNEIALSFL